MSISGRCTRFRTARHRQDPWPGGAIEAFEAAKKAGKCRFIGFTGHYDPEAHAALLKAYDKWDTVMMPVHAADHAYLSFEKWLSRKPSNAA